MRPLSPGSQLQARRIVGLLIRDGIRLKLIDASALDCHRAGNVIPITRLSPSEDDVVALVNGLWQSLHRHKRGAKMDRRWFAAGLAFWCGASSTEMASLKWEHVRFESRRAEVLLPERTLGTANWQALPMILSRPLLDWRRAHAPSAGEPVFSNGYKAAVTDRTIVRWIRDVYQRAVPDSEPVNTRKLRNAFIVSARRCGWPDTEIAARIRRYRVSLPSDRLKTKELNRALDALERDLHVAVTGIGRRVILAHR